jgi:uncharacterized protein (DUF2147 family)
MRLLTFAAALGLFTAALVGAGASQAFAADPSGIWAKDDGSAKMEIKKCGKSLCSKIVWLKDPNDSKGKPLHDERNEDPSMRDRPIIGLPLFDNMTPAEPNTWVGNVYNPEEGHIYDNVKVTLVSRQQIVLRGCKGWLFCGEKVWTRSTMPAPATEPEQVPDDQQEAKAQTGEPAIEAAADAAPAPRKPVIEAAADDDSPAPPMPASKPDHDAADGDSQSEPMQIEANAAGAGEPAHDGAAASPWQHASMGYDALFAAAGSEPVQPFSSQSVSTMFVTIPRVADATADGTATDAVDQPQVETPKAVPVPLPAAKPKAKPLAQPHPQPHPTQSAANTGDTDAATSAVKPKPKPKPAAKPEPVATDLPWLQHP